MKCVARMRSSRLFFGVIVEGDSVHCLVSLLCRVGKRGLLSQTYLTGEFLKGDVFIDPEVALTLPARLFARGTWATRGIFSVCCWR